VKVVDSATAAEITKALNDTQPQADGSKYIGLNFQSSEGKIPDAITLLEDMHKSDTDCIVSCSGVLDLASVITIAGGKFGERKADSTALFILCGDSASAGKKRKALNAEEKNTLEILEKLSGGRKSRIKAFMLSGTKVTAAEMKSLGLIDKIDGEFVDKYAQARIDAKEEAKKNKKK